MSNFIALLRKSILGLDRYQAFLLTAWLILSISLPILWQVFGMQIMLQALVLLILTQVLLVLNVLYNAWGWWSMLRTAVTIVFIAWAALAINLRSGYPFGSNHYSDLLLPKIMGVPILVPLLWLMMLPPAWTVVKLITRKVKGCLMRPVFVLASALAFTAWDLYLDPLMARWGIWEWQAQAGYFGIPWLNFVGWVVVSVVLTFAISPKRLPGGLLVLVYALTWLSLFFLAMFWGLMGVAIIGFLSMGVIILLAALCSK
jgi:putative membrane protein